MEIFKYVYFLTIAVIVVQAIFAKEKRLNWPLIVSAIGIHCYYFFGWEGIAFLLAAGIISTVIELISLKTPFNVFGVSYRYDLKNTMFPSRIVLGEVFPIEVTAAWVLFKYLSFFLSSLILERLGVGGILRILFSAFTLVSFDFLLDPYAVAKGGWKWKRSGIFFGIPWQNFFGWFIVGVVTSFFAPHTQVVGVKDIVMGIPIIVVSFLFPLQFGKKLFSMDRVKGIIALVPLSLILLVSLYSLLA